MCWSKQVYVSPTRRPVTPTPPSPFFGAVTGRNDTTMNNYTSNIYPTDTYVSCTSDYNECNSTEDHCFPGNYWKCCVAKSDSSLRFCKCKDDFHGDMCEQQLFDFVKHSPASASTWAIVGVLGLLVIAVVVIIIVCVVRRKDRSPSPGEHPERARPTGPEGSEKRASGARKPYPKNPESDCLIEMKVTDKSDTPPRHTSALPVKNGIYPTLGDPADVNCNDVSPNGNSVKT